MINPHDANCGCALCRAARPRPVARIVGAEDADDILGVRVETHPCPTCVGEGGWLDNGEPSICDDCGGSGRAGAPVADAIAAHVRGDVEPGTRAADDARLAIAEAAELDRLDEADLLDRYVFAVVTGYVAATVKHADDVDAQPMCAGYDAWIAHRVEEMAAAWLAERRKRP